MRSLTIPEMLAHFDRDHLYPNENVSQELKKDMRSLIAKGKIIYDPFNLANRQKLDFKESDPDLPETNDPRPHASRKQKAARDIAKKKHEIWIDEVGLEE